MGNDQRSDGSSSSSKKNKNKSKNNSSNSGSNSNSNSNNSSDKPKQPQRGLGVAQLERIRLHSQMASCGFLPQQLNNNGFPIHFPNNTVFQHVNDDMRLQGGYQAGLLQSSSTTPFVYGIPENLSSSSYNYQQQHHHHHHHHHPNNLMMGVGEQMERTCNFRFGESHPSMTTRSWNPNNGSLVTVSPENNQYIQPQGLVTRHLLNHVEQNSRRDDLHEPSGSGSQNSESSAENYEELNLELKL